VSICVKKTAPLDLAKFLAYILTMKTANVGQLKDNLSKFLSDVEKGETITICKRNIPIAALVPHGSRKTGNHTKLGSGMGTVQIDGDLTEPLIPENTWNMHRL
jgi:prevent-host-death family protein